MRPFVPHGCGPEPLSAFIGAAIGASLAHRRSQAARYGTGPEAGEAAKVPLAPSLKMGRVWQGHGLVHAVIQVEEGVEWPENQ